MALARGIAGPVSAAASPPFAPGPGNKWPGRVAINFNGKAVVNAKPDGAVVKKMVDDLVCLLAGQDSPGDAWKEIFPSSLTLQSKIAVKINTANTGQPAPCWESVRAVTDGLQQMKIGGTPFPASNIKIYDMNFLNGLEPAGYSSKNFPGIAIEYTTLTDGGDGAMDNHRYASQLKEADFLINIFSPRGHTYPPAGSRFTLNFKSHIGTYASEYRTEGPSLHDALMENLREMNCTGPVYKKNVLSVCSGIFAMNEGHGPGGNADNFFVYAKSIDTSVTDPAPSTTIMISTDPVAIEMQSIKMLRINNKGKYGLSDMPPYLQASAGITGKMSGTTCNIGIIDESKMDIRRVINDVTHVDHAVFPGKTPRFRIMAVSPKGRRTIFFEYCLPESCTGNPVTVSLYSLRGELLIKKTDTALGALNHFSWDYRDMHGRFVGAGNYVISAASRGIRLSERFAVSR